MTGNVEVDGEIDAGWTSYYDGGETVEVTPDDAGEENFILLPDEVEGKELTERQTTIIREAVANPECTLQDIADLEESWSASSVRGTMIKKCPEWYERVFSSSGQSKNSTSGNDFLITDDEIVQMADEINGLTANDIMEEVGMTRSSALDRLNDLEESGILTYETGVDGFHSNEKVFFLADLSNEEIGQVEEENEDVGEETQTVEEAVSQEFAQDTMEIPTSFVEDVMEFESIHAEDENTISEIETVCEHVVKVDGEGSLLAETVLEIIRE